MRTRTVRGLAAGAGAVVVLLAGGATAVALPDSAQWEDEFAQQSGKDDVTCLVSNVNGAPGILALSVEDGTWAPFLEPGNEWVGLAIDVDSRFDVQQWRGYTTYEYGGAASDGSNIDNAVICQAPLGDARPVAEATEDESAEADTPSGPPVADAADADEVADANGNTDDDNTDDNAPTGPPVETDGPAVPSGPNLGLVGGAALFLGGTGAAGWAVRRRAGQH